ncbi:hypothetical protein Ahia01_000549600 [Argonauta hians]
MLGGVEVIIGMDVITEMGGVEIGGAHGVRFGREWPGGQGGSPQVSLEGEGDEGAVVETEPHCAISDVDFHAELKDGRWTVEWVWKDKPPVLQKQIGCYESTLRGGSRREFEEEVDRWVDEGILRPWEGEERGGVLPLMAVVQSTKKKVRPVLDYRELNEHVACHTGGDGIDICGEALREWRRMSGSAAIVDLKAAYLQIHVAERLWRYQLVRYKGKLYCLTRLGFGLNSAPKIMASILRTVLGQSERVRVATNSYIDDILVDETKVKGEEVVGHLREFGLVAKPPVPMAGGAALGLRLREGEDGELQFRRGNEVPKIEGELSRRQLFSVCGKLVGHYPIAGWLRVACSYIKRTAGGTGWADKVGQRTVQQMAEVLDRVEREDPVRGQWHVPRSSEGVVWCDASSLALGVVLEIGGVEVEDAAWLRKKEDVGHINVAELDAVLRGVNLALQWDLREIEIRTDSATVLSWLRSTINSEGRVKTKGAAEMLVKRRLGVLSELVEEVGLSLQVTFVPSAKNKADGLTRVKRSWLSTAAKAVGVSAVAMADPVVKQGHDRHHMGVDRTLYLARLVEPTTSREEVERVVRECIPCQSIDPAPSSHRRGRLDVRESWKRLAIDVTHYRHRTYLSMVDCGSGRFAIWRELRTENASEVASVLEQLFLERGPVDEALMDNSPSFRSEVLRQTLERWKVRPYYRAAYRPNGNGIVERNHRTIKAMAERSQISPQEAVFWYNMTPRVGQADETVPHRAVYGYAWRHPDVPPPEPETDEGEPAVTVGEEVWVKPPSVRCTSQWGRGIVTGVNSANNISVDGVPRHILDIRRLFRQDNDVAGDQCGEEPGADLSESEGQGATVTKAAPRRSGRIRSQPVWHRDYEMTEGPVGGEGPE